MLKAPMIHKPPAFVKIQKGVSSAARGNSRINRKILIRTIQFVLYLYFMNLLLPFASVEYDKPFVIFTFCYVLHCHFQYSNR